MYCICTWTVDVFCTQNKLHTFNEMLYFQIRKLICFAIYRLTCRIVFHYSTFKKALPTVINQFALWLITEIDILSSLKTKSILTELNTDYFGAVLFPPTSLMIAK